MFIPVGSFMQYIEQIDKDAEGNIHTKKVMGVRVSFSWRFIAKRPIASLTLLLQYVPLTDKEAQVGD